MPKCSEEEKEEDRTKGPLEAVRLCLHADDMIRSDDPRTYVRTHVQSLGDAHIVHVKVINKKIARSETF